MKALASSVVCIGLVTVVTPAFASPAGRLIREVSVAPAYFSPSLGQRETIAFSLARRGRLSVLILDRDGYLVRTLVAGKSVESGKQTLSWDGRSDPIGGKAGDLLPDEAYSLKIDLAAGSETETYAPASE